jgi:hypothetical protein
VKAKSSAPRRKVTSMTVAGWDPKSNGPMLSVAARLNSS